MESKNYSNMYSYLRIIMELLNKEEELENYVLGDIFNNKVNNMEEEEIKYMYVYSALFENKLLNMTEDKRSFLIKSLYESYIKSMIINYSNGHIETAYVFYSLLEEKIKMMSGFYGVFEYKDNVKVKKVI